MRRFLLLMVLVAVAFIPAHPAYADEWIACAGENQTCKVPGTRMVRYGVGDQWSLKKATDRIQCNNDIFGDPAPGRGKACYYRDTFRYDRDEDRRARWSRCADEGATCRFRGFRDIRYGVGDRWSYKSAKDGVACNNDEFGDPAPGKMKECFIRMD